MQKNHCFFHSIWDLKRQQATHFDTLFFMFLLLLLFLVYKFNEKVKKAKCFYWTKKFPVELHLLRRIGSQKIDFLIAFFNRITIQKVNAKVLNCLVEKWKNERQKVWAPFVEIDGPQEIKPYFISVPFCSDCKKTEVQIGLKIFFLSQIMFLYGLNLRKILLQKVFFFLNCLFNFLIVYWNFSIKKY